MIPRLTVFAVEGLPEIRPGDDLAQLILERVGDELEDGDILAITSKIVSKAEGRIVAADDREDAITAETVREVARRQHPGGVTRIVQNKLGLVLAAAGVDSSNTEEGTVLLLPVDPDATARSIAGIVREKTGKLVGVIITDTLGRPWREGQTDVAIGAGGMLVFNDLRGSVDAAGRPLTVTLTTVADEVAAAADLVKGKASGIPVAVVRGLGEFVTDLDAPGATAIVRPLENDMFKLGSAEAFAEGYSEGFAVGREHHETSDLSDRLTL